MKKIIRIGFPNKPAKIGGPATFQNNLSKFLRSNSFTVCNNVNKNVDCIIVISSTSKIFSLIKCKLKNIKIIHRLDGINYKPLSKVGNLRLFIYFRLVNILMSFIRRYLADYIIYQSKFTEDWWNESYGKIKSPSKIIYNGTYEVINNKAKAENYEIICIEGNYNEKENLELIEQVYLNLNKKIFKKLILLEIFLSHLRQSSLNILIFMYMV